jgi:predicted dehydrogenase
MTQRINRRHFLLSAAAVAATGPLVLSAPKLPAPSERLRVGAVGIAGQGNSDLNAIAAAGAEIVALCDVDTNRKQVVAQRNRFSKAKFYTDFRKMIDAGGLDAVMVATPDHTHAPAALTALKADLHVFCEKPLTHTVAEARLLAETAHKKKRVTQMGTQIHAGDNYRRVVELIRAGAIGPVKEVHCWVSTTYGGSDRPKQKMDVPAGLEWDLWLGPAPVRPYHSTYVPFYWRGWWDFGGGALNDMACHHMDLPFWALDLHHPTHVEAEGPKPHPESTGPWLIVRYDFPTRGKLPPVKVTWYDSGKRPRYFEEKGLLPKWGNGTLFVGEKGMLLADYGKHVLLPEKVFKDYPAPKPTIPNSIGHYKEWVEACKGNGSTTCNFDYSGALTEAVLLGTVSYRLGKGFNWDAKQFKASEPGAERFLRKEYRKGWEVA